MANKRISSLDPLTTPAVDDIIPVTDISDTVTSGNPNGTTKKVTVANLIAVAPQGDLESANNLSDLADAATARANLGVDDAGTDNSTNVTLSGTPDYITISGQTITRNQIDLATDVTGLLPNASVDGLGTAATTDSADYATASHTHALETDLSDLTISSKASEDVIKWNGSSWVNGQVSVDVQTPIDEGITLALRGSNNPHIGAYPNQSFKVIDNPYQSVMVVADEAGNLKLLNSLGVNNIAVGFSVVEDGTEPDIEVVSGSETYSVISGDSDSKGANGLPLRQGFNLPDIGANPAPILISGGSIA